MTRPVLPVWADNDNGRSLIDRIIVERPHWHLRAYEGSRINGEHVFEGKAAGQLRYMHHKWLEREFASLDAQYAVCGLWDQRASDALFRTEDANKLVERVLRETERAELEPKELPNGGFMVAA